MFTSTEFPKHLARLRFVFRFAQDQSINNDNCIGAQYPRFGIFLGDNHRLIMREPFDVLPRAFSRKIILIDVSRYYFEI